MTGGPSKSIRKIIHVDMDAFYASVEQRDNPELRGKPVVVARRAPRAVVTAASYEARRYGIHSAMPAMRADRLCPHAIFVPPDFARYKAVSARIQAIFRRYASEVEPLSLDEAYLDVTHPLIPSPSATATATAVRAAILAETGLTASAGIAPNKFLAKIASDWRKPNGQFVVKPGHIHHFLATLDVAKIPGVGRVMHQKLSAMGIRTVGDLRTVDEKILIQRFGRWGKRLAGLAVGIDERPVQSHRLTEQISAEDTLEKDLPLAELTPYIKRMAEKTWHSYERKADRIACTVVLKLKTADFHILTRSHTPTIPPRSSHELFTIASALRGRVQRSPKEQYRLVGVGLSGFVDHHEAVRQTRLFDDV